MSKNNNEQKGREVAGKTVRIWYIKNREETGYWSDRAELFLDEFINMSPDEKFEIKCKDLTEEEFLKLEEKSPEFQGW